MNAPLFSLIFTALTLGAAHAQDDGAAAAERKYAEVCKTCHGPTGKGMASFPRLAGRDADYITSRLQQYRAGEKVGPNSALMMPHAAQLTDDEIANLAAYISSTFR